MFKAYNINMVINKYLEIFGGNNRLTLVTYTFFLSLIASLSFLIYFDTKYILRVLFFFPLICGLYIFFIPAEKKSFLKLVSLSVAAVEFLLSLLLWTNFNKSVSKFQFVEYIDYSYTWDSGCTYTITLGIDGISLFFILLTTLLIFLCLLACWENLDYYIKEYVLCFLFLESLLIGVFSFLDIFLFYVLFESTLIPMYIIILIYGSRQRKIRAGNFLFLYTLFSSVFMLAAIIYIYWILDTTDYQLILASSNFTTYEQHIMWFVFYLSFATKVPMLPFHIWLPEAHVEAPTAGSVILAGILLKLGTYGFLRYSLALFTESNYYFAPFIYSLSVLGVIYTSLTAIRQTDFKRIIAYTSIAHMNIVMIGIYSLNVIGLEGSIIQSISHGFVSSALFLLIGVFYDRFHTRLIKYCSGLVHCMPLYALIFLFFTMANIGLPGTSSFVGEFLILTGSFKENITVTFLGASSMVLGSVYSLWLYNRMIFGNLKTDLQFSYIEIKKYYDLNRREIYIFFPLILGTLVLGFYPKIFLDYLNCSTLNLILKLE